MRKYLVVIMSLLLVSCGSGKKTNEEAKADIYSMKGVHLTQTIKGDTKLTIDALEAQIYPKERILKAFKVNLKYFEKEKEISNLVSDTGSINLSTNDIEVSEHVTLKTKDGAMLETSSLKWSDRLGKLTSDAFVKVTKGDNVMTGYGLESDMMLENVMIRKVATKVSDMETLKNTK